MTDQHEMPKLADGGTPNAGTHIAVRDEYLSDLFPHLFPLLIERLSRLNRQTNESSDARSPPTSNSCEEMKHGHG